MISGELNSRFGDLSEYIDRVDQVASREVIDYMVNEYGQMLVDFMIVTNICMLNGRVGSQNFTSICL